MGESLGTRGRIWDGYVHHWRDRAVVGRLLPEPDYETGKPIVLLWPAAFDDRSQTSHFQLYMNERLTQFRGSILGHSAINVGGWVFNFSYRSIENEVLPVEEYLYRPALGPFGVHPSLGRVNEALDEKPYNNNFGRLFARSIHVLDVETHEEVVARLFSFFRATMRVIHKAPVNPNAPTFNSYFHYYRRNCATIIRDGLRRTGMFPVRGLTPRDLFESAYRVFRRAEKRGECRLKYGKMEQLKVPEAPYSAEVSPLNPLNRARHILGMGISPLDSSGISS